MTDQARVSTSSGMRHTLLTLPADTPHEWLEAAVAWVDSWPHVDPVEWQRWSEATAEYERIVNGRV